MRGYQTQQLRVTSCDALKCAFLQRHGNHWSNPTGSCKVSNPEDRVYVVLVVRKTKVDASVKTQKYFHTTWHGSQVKIPVLWRKCQRTRAGEKMRIKKRKWKVNFKSSSSNCVFTQQCLQGPFLFYQLQNGGGKSSLHLSAFLFFIFIFLRQSVTEQYKKEAF